MCECVSVPVACDVIQFWSLNCVKTPTVNGTETLPVAFAVKYDGPEISVGVASLYVVVSSLCTAP